MDYKEVEALRATSLYMTGARVSIVQSALFWVIAASALVLGIDRFVTDGLDGLCAANPPLFTVLCGAFVLIAILGLAITPAEKKLIEGGGRDDGPASWGSGLACLGHMGTIAFFSWWMLRALPGGDVIQASAGALMPLRWGIMFELLFVGAWVWIIAWVLFRRGLQSPGFRIVSICKAVSFWFAFAAFMANDAVLLVVGVGLAAAVFGPLWHVWIAVIFARNSAKGA